jgi:hypothetical protein
MSAASKVAAAQAKVEALRQAAIESKQSALEQAKYKGWRFCTRCHRRVPCNDKNCKKSPCTDLATCPCPSETFKARNHGPEMKLLRAERKLTAATLVRFSASCDLLFWDSATS